MNLANCISGAASGGDYGLLEDLGGLIKPGLKIAQLIDKHPVFGPLASALVKVAGGLAKDLFALFDEEKDPKKGTEGPTE